jgi:two-component system, cell cycle sensor histidine kinase and response regulator CckA
MTAVMLPILIVDDDAQLRTSLQDVLRLQGYEPRIASSGAKALEVVRTMDVPPALAVVDLRLPDMDGIELAAQLHRLSELTQVIILTGHATLDSAVRAMRAQSYDYLVKPVAPDKLFTTLQTAGERWHRQVAEVELHRTQELLRAVFEASPLPIVALDENETVRLWNGAAERLFGWTASEVVGRTLPVVPSGQEGHARALGEAALRGETITGLDVRRRRRDGTLVDVRVSVAAIRHPSGAIEGILAVYEDVTERRQFEAEMRQAQRLDAIGRLAGGVAHDFNNLLTVILGETALALEEPMDPVVRDALLTTRETAERGAALTRQLLAFARRQPLAPQVFDPNELIGNLEKMLRRLLGDRITLLTALEPGCGSIQADRGQIEQVVTNLVVNARDAIRGTGVVTISTSARHCLPDREGLPDAAVWVEIAVNDTGTGMSEAIRSRLFEPFFTTKGNGEGTGLGLATSYGIVKQSGGTILVETVQDEGSTFRVCLPRAEAVDVPTIDPRPAGVAGGSERLLVVEDMPTVRRVTERLLSRLGYVVTTVADGHEALALMIDRGPPDLLLTDMNLPDITGRELVAHARARWPELRVLYVSGDPSPLVGAESDDLFLTKPYQIEHLDQMIRATLDGR